MPEMLELLLVEDDPAIVSTLSDFLQQEGFSITAASGVFIWLCWTSL